MSLSLPNGTVYSIAASMAAAIAITAISNENPAVVTAAAHNLANGDVVVITSGWPALNGRVARVVDAQSGEFALEKFDTTDVDLFPVGSGIGSVRKVLTWQPVSQVLEASISGGEQQFYNYQYLEDKGDERQIPTIRSARSASLQIADDDSLPQYSVLEKADAERTARPVRVQLPTKSVIYYAAFVSFNKVPTQTKNQGMALTVTLSIDGEPTRYSGAQA